MPASELGSLANDLSLVRFKVNSTWLIAAGAAVGKATHGAS
jgi:hypothetical protein